MVHAGSRTSVQPEKMGHGRKFLSIKGADDFPFFIRNESLLHGASCPGSGFAGPEAVKKAGALTDPTIQRETGNPLFQSKVDEKTVLSWPFV